MARGRFAPSPTGPLHLGHAQTMLLGWLQIRALGGQFVLRIEDIDRARCKPAASEAIVRDLDWLGFDWDEGPDVGGPFGSYVQSERFDAYRDAVARLGDRTFRCTCSRKEMRAAAGAPDPETGEWPYAGTCRAGESHPGRPASIRARVEPELVRWSDQWQGPCAQDPSRVCGDFILWSKADEPTYQLAVVVDDIHQRITHVLRGEDLLTSTARQLLLYRWLDAPAPVHAHTPLRRDDDGQRLAKSRGSAGLGELREAGVDPRAVLGRLAAGLGILETPTPVTPVDLIEPFRRWPSAARLLTLPPALDPM